MCLDKRKVLVACISALCLDPIMVWRPGTIGLYHEFEVCWSYNTKIVCVHRLIVKHELVLFAVSFWSPSLSGWHSGT
ncbi:hypothetical protein AB3S75_024996 [Citrus x aurantiifolia]